MVVRRWVVVAAPAAAPRGGRGPGAPARRARPRLIIESGPAASDGSGPSVAGRRPGPAASGRGLQTRTADRATSPASMASGRPYWPDHRQGALVGLGRLRVRVAVAQWSVAGDSESAAGPCHPRCAGSDVMASRLDRQVSSVYVPDSDFRSVNLDADSDEAGSTPGDRTEPACSFVTGPTKKGREALLNEPGSERFRI